MPRLLSNAAKEELFAQESDEVFAFLITIEHSTLTNPIRVTNDNPTDLGSGIRGIQSAGHDFIFFPFEITMQEEDETLSPSVRLRIENISREIGLAVRKMTTPATAKIELVRSSAPDTIEAAIPEMIMRNVTYDASMVEATLYAELYDQEPFPSGRITPSGFPGAF